MQHVTVSKAATGNALISQASRDGGSYDLIVANLYSDLLEQSFSRLIDWLKPDGILLVSGILHELRPSVLTAAAMAGWCEIEVRQRGPWITASLHKADSEA